VDATLRDLIAARLRDVSDFPKPGIVFKDITPLLADGAAFARVVRALGALAPDVDAVAGIEARGFLLSGAISGELGCGLIPIRKAGKLPPPTVRRSYSLEYGEAEIELPVDAAPGRGEGRASQPDASRTALSTPMARSSLAWSIRNWIASAPASAAASLIASSRG